MYLLLPFTIATKNTLSLPCFLSSLSQRPIRIRSESFGFYRIQGPPTVSTSLQRLQLLQLLLSSILRIRLQNPIRNPNPNPPFSQRLKTPMTDNFSSTRKVADFGFNPPQNNAQTTQKKIADDQRRETHFCKMGFDGNGFKTNDLKQEKGGKNESKEGPLETANEKGTFWTACSYCYYMYEYEKKYEGCCLLCRNCRKAFHAVAVAPPPKGLLVKGFSQSSYSGNSLLGEKKEVSGGDTGKKHNVVDISDDSDDEKKGMDVKNGAGKMKVEGLNNREGRVVMKRVKSVPRNTKKMAGRGVKGKKVEKVSVVGMTVEFGNGVADGGRRLGSGSRSHQNGSNEDELEFFEGDDDIFVGLRDIC